MYQYHSSKKPINSLINISNDKNNISTFLMNTKPWTSKDYKWQTWYYENEFSTIKFVFIK